MERHSSTTRQHHNPLWDYICDQYRKPGMAGYCLALQDQSQADVNLLLSCGWIARSITPPSNVAGVNAGTLADGKQPGARAGSKLIYASPDDLPWPLLLAVSHQWQNRLRDLRELRRSLHKDQPDQLRLRNSVLRLELAGEKQEVDALWRELSTYSAFVRADNTWSIGQVLHSYAKAVNIPVSKMGQTLDFIALSLGT